MAQVTRDSPVAPHPTDALPTAESINRVIADINAKLDAVWGTLAALDARLAAGER